MIHKPEFLDVRYTEVVVGVVKKRVRSRETENVIYLPNANLPQMETLHANIGFVDLKRRENGLFLF